MSSSIQEERANWANQVHKASENRDIEELFRLSRIVVKFDEEWGQAIRQLARRFDREEWGHDESIGN